MLCWQLDTEVMWTFLISFLGSLDTLNSYHLEFRACLAFSSKWTHRHPCYACSFKNIIEAINQIATVGTFAFLRSISLEAIGLGVHLAAGAHDILLQAEYILSSIPPSVPWPVENRLATNLKSNQPNDAQQGIQQVNIATLLNCCLFIMVLYWSLNYGLSVYEIVITLSALSSRLLAWKGYSIAFSHSSSYRRQYLVFLLLLWTSS